MEGTYTYVPPLATPLLPIAEYRQIITPAVYSHTVTQNAHLMVNRIAYRNPDRKCKKIKNCNLTLLFWVLCATATIRSYVPVEPISDATAIQVFSLILASRNSFNLVLYSMGLLQTSTWSINFQCKSHQLDVTAIFVCHIT